jgi:anti-sigma28 factor (negative regulator of flagellin synthesis)
MVDSVNPSNQSVNVLSVGKSQAYEDQKKTKEPAKQSPIDEVRISPQAQSISEAQKAANDVAKALEAQPDVTLSSNAERLSTLA